MFRILPLVLATAAFATAALAQNGGPEPLDWDMVTKIRQEGLHRSQAMDLLEHLTETIGPRLTNSPQERAAAAWCAEKLNEWGLTNVQREPWGEFGRGWSFSRCTVHLVSPRQTPLFGIPVAWTPGTNGPVQGPVKRVDIDKEEDIEKFRGKLAGHIVLLDELRQPDHEDAPPFSRRDIKDLEELETFPIPGERGEDWRKDAIKRWRLINKTRAFFREEGVLAVLTISSRDFGVVRLGGNRAYEVGEPAGPPTVTLTAEHYNRVARFAKVDDVETIVSVDVAATFHEDDTTGRNVVGEIRGRRRPNEVVIIGGHLDSWHGGTGATDNAAGVVTAMEAMRILQAVGAQPRRTIRIALWTGEEQGLLGSRGYVEKNFAYRPEPTDPEQLELPRWYRKETWPIITRPAHKNVSAYFNFDNGGGRIRGIYAQENHAVVPIFQAWLEPLHDLGATTVSTRNTSSTDHIPFDNVGLPGFQFIQDPLAYFSRTHHTHLDTIDQIDREDLLQSAVVMATFAYHAANRHDLLPRKPMPQPPLEDEEDHEDDEDDEE